MLANDGGGSTNMFGRWLERHHHLRLVKQTDSSLGVGGEKAGEEEEETVVFMSSLDGGGQSCVNPNP